MNERIKELIKQHGVDITIDGMGYGEGNIEGLAELIVRECANMCYKASKESFRLNEVKAGAMGMALKVLMEEHFGVEE